MEIKAARSFETSHKQKENNMKLSARNILKGKIVKITKGPLNSLVVVQVAPGINISSVITSEAVKELKLAKGKTAYAIIKAPSVILGVDD
jgi:molybdopterin-binding protein